MSLTLKNIGAFSSKTGKRKQHARLEDTKGELIITLFVAYIFFKFIFIYFERERVKASGGGAQRLRERILDSVEPDVGLELMKFEIIT